jgi:hypothetical protein
VQWKHLSVDGSLVEANAAKASRIPHERLVEGAEVHHSVREYLVELEQQNPVEEPVHEQDLVSITDPDSCHSPKLDRARLELREALRYQSHSRISGSSQRSISMEWC